MGERVSVSEMEQIRMGLEIDGYFIRDVYVSGNPDDSGVFKIRLEDPTLTQEVLGVMRNADGVNVLKTVVWDEAKMGLGVYDTSLDPQKRNSKRMERIYDLITYEGFARIDFPELDKVILYKPLQFVRA